MVELRRVPPGRAGRLWLRARLRAGRLATDLLGRKLVILHVEEDRLRRLAEPAQARWRQAWRLADAWMLRAGMLAGARELSLSRRAEPAVVSVSWANVMGVRYPTEAVCRIPSASVADRGPGSAAMVEAGVAFEDALRAATEYAAIDTARRIVEADITVTRRRLRAISDRWVPRLEEALRELSRELDENERAETFRLRWAAAGGAGRTAPGPRDVRP